MIKSAADSPTDDLLLASELGVLLLHLSLSLSLKNRNVAFWKVFDHPLGLLTFSSSSCVSVSASILNPPWEGLTALPRWGFRFGF